MDSLIRLISDSIAFWAAATLAIVVVPLFLLLRGRKLRSPGQSKRTSNWRVLSCYADTHPSFVYVLKSLRRKNRLEELLQDDEMRQALDCLRRWQRSASSTEKVSVLDLAVGPEAKSQRVEAAMVTLLRGVFTNSTCSNCLPERAHRELDSFLDSLTD